MIKEKLLSKFDRFYEKINQKEFVSMKSVLEFYSKPRKKKQPDVFCGEDDILLMIEAEQDGETKKRQPDYSSVIYSRRIVLFNIFKKEGASRVVGTVSN